MWEMLQGVDTFSFDDTKTDQTQIIEECSIIAWRAIRKPRYERDYKSWQTSVGDDLECEYDCEDTYDIDRAAQEKAWKDCITRFAFNQMPRRFSLPFKELDEMYRL